MKSIIFTETGAVDYKTGIIKEKSSVIANIRRKKQKNEIVSYKIKELVGGSHFLIQYKDGSKEKIEIPKRDRYRIILNTILKEKKKVYDEITCVINGGYKEQQKGNINIFSPWEAIITEEATDDRIVKSPIEVIEYVKNIYQNDEICSFQKKGKEKLEYEIITIEDEKIRILTPLGNKVVPILDDILKAYQKTNNRLMIKNIKGKLKPVCSVAAIIAACGLVVTSPYTDQVVKLVTNVIEDAIEKDNLKYTMQSNLLVMSSYYTRLKMDGILSNEDYDHFLSLIHETKDYYEQNNMTDSIDYELILDYQELADSKYQSVRSAGSWSNGTSKQ